MPPNMIRFPRKGDPPRLYAPSEIAEATGITYSMALWLCQTYGIKMRKRYYISMAQYDVAMKALGVKQHA